MSLTKTSLCWPAWSVFHSLFQWLLNIHFVPRSWKMSTIMSVPKNPGARQLNDFRPVALTSIIAKSMGRRACSQLITSVADRMDPLQFAYRAGGHVEDATLSLFNLISDHLDTSGTTVRVLFTDFFISFQYSSAPCSHLEAIEP